MKFESPSLQLISLEDGITELRFDLKDDSVNKFNAATLGFLRKAVDVLKTDASLRAF